MELLPHLSRLFEYDHWANRATLASLRQAAPCPPRSVTLLAHVVAASHVWHARIRGEPAPLPVWPELTLDEVAAHVQALRGAWADLLAGLDPAGLDRVASYTTSQGERWSTPVGDILTHVLLHSAYHRGQIAREQRAGGSTPAFTDFIHAVRQGLVE
jgi:uncharacterized damage-inducible protein DinB